MSRPPFTVAHAQSRAGDAVALLSEAERRWPAHPGREHKLTLTLHEDGLLLHLALGLWYPFLLAPSDVDRPVDDVLGEVDEMLRERYPEAVQ